MAEEVKTVTEKYPNKTANLHDQPPLHPSTAKYRGQEEKPEDKINAPGN